MTRCYFYLKNASKYVVKVVGTRGDEWGNIVNAEHSPNEGNFTIVQSMGCPRAGTESDHWGWLYLMAYPKDDRNFTKYFTVFVRLRHSGDCFQMGMDWTYMKSDDEKPEYMPPRDMPSNGCEDAGKDFPPLGHLSWYPDKSNQDFRPRQGGEYGSPVVEITVNL
ncbi:hypothetical protein BDV97DRAFT_401717 [Delphinella strobiligena]|nr:hypothetical protein BDV97DRAFT_401717 [Delphinella strobiligena]